MMAPLQFGNGRLRRATLQLSEDSVKTEGREIGAGREAYIGKDAGCRAGIFLYAPFGPSAAPTDENRISHYPMIFLLQPRL